VHGSNKLGNEEKSGLEQAGPVRSGAPQGC
jgi:hypothetical protein